jgi:hypothetical protein
MEKNGLSFTEDVGVGVCLNFALTSILFSVYDLDVVWMSAVRGI